MENSLKMLSLNLHMYDRGDGYKTRRSTHDVLSFLLREKSTFLALQEFGRKSYSGDVDGASLMDGLRNAGYKTISPEINGVQPVNVRLLYDINKVDLIEKLPPLYESFVNRQAGGAFRRKDGTGEKMVVYSLHLPLFQNNELEKLAFWTNIINFAKASVSGEDSIFLMGDFNEDADSAKRTALFEKIKELEQYLTPASENIATWRDKRLDHIFVSNGLTTQYKTLETANMSDHKALTLSLS